jgi:hypothetical protein
MDTNNHQSRSRSNNPGKGPVVFEPPSQIIPCDAKPLPFLPLEEPPISLEEYPRLDTHPRGNFSIPGYSVSTHVFPAAWPRCPSTAFIPPSARNAIVCPRDKDAIATLVKDLALVKEAQEAGRDERTLNRNVLWTVANRIYSTSPKRDSKGLTLVLLHGIGSHKESWEPAIKRVLSALHESSSSLHVEEIWMLDGVQHGDSAVLNEELLGDTFDGADYARDALNFLLSYLPSRCQLHLPTALPRTTDIEKTKRQKSGLTFRTLVGVGHSMGGCSLLVLYSFALTPCSR